MILNKEDRLLIVHRRIFENDKSRYFIGTVEAYEVGIAKIRGHTFVRNPHTTVFIKKPDERVKVISLSSGTIFAYLLKPGINLSKLHFETDPSGSFFLKEDQEKIMDLTEVPHE